MPRDDYFNWLCQLVGRANRYYLLLGHLYRTEFYSLLPMDNNREMDGLDLRYVYAEEGGNTAPPFCSDGHCTVLELLIGLAKRMSSQLEDSKMAMSLSDSFWIMIGNLGLGRFDNYEYRSLEDPGIITHKLHVFMDRTYLPNGIGGLFPVEGTSYDQRNLELWYQLMEYLTRKVVI